MQPVIAAYVAERAQRSIHLLEGLRAALIVLGRKDLARIAELVSEDAIAARTAIQLARERGTRARRRALLEDLQILSMMAGPKSAQIVLRTARIVQRSCG